MSDLKTIRLGTRGSALALWQAETVKAALLAEFPDLTVNIQVIKTSGDKDLTTPLDSLPFTGYFTKELEHALVNGEIDMAVHSLKDMAVRTVDPFTLAAVLPRGPVEDALLLNPKYQTVADLPEKPLFLTGSIRRQKQLERIFPGCRYEHVRGNMQTRIRKVTDLDADALVLAKAAVVRLGITDQNVVDLSIDQMIPAPAQGAVGIECLRGNSHMRALLKTLEDPITRRAVDVERHITAILEGGCSLPLGVHAATVGGDLHVTAGFFPDSADDAQIIRGIISATDDPLEIAGTMAAGIKTK